MKAVLAKGLSIRCTDAEALGGDPDARQEPHQIPARWRERRLVEIIDIEVDEAVVALVAAEVLQVQIASHPDRGR